MTQPERILQVVYANPGCTARELGVILGWRPVQLHRMFVTGRLRRTGRGWSADPFRWYAREQGPAQVPVEERTHHVLIHTDGRIELFGWGVQDIAEFVTLLHARRALTSEDTVHAH